MFSKWMYLTLMIFCIVYGLVEKNLNETMSIIISIWFIGSAYNKYGFTHGLMTAWMPLPESYKGGE